MTSPSPAPRSSPGETLSDPRGARDHARVTTESTVSDDALLPSPARAEAGAGQPAVPSWLTPRSDDHRLTTLLAEDQRAWVVAVCEASHAQGGTLSPTTIVRAAIAQLMREHADATQAAGALRGSPPAG